MMEKLTARSFCEFSIFTFLSFAKVLSISSESVSENIIDVMQNDLKQCDVPQFVYENNIIKNCSNLKYPDKDKILIYNNRNTFLCLAFYDTWYKICTSGILNQIQYDDIKFELTQELFNEKEDHHVTMFCENIKNVSFSHKKLKPFLSLIHFNKPVCYLICFDIAQKFNPLCAVLAWSKSIDENIKSSNKTEHTQVQNSTVHTKVQQSNTSNSGLNKTTEGTMTSGNAHQVKPTLPNSVQTLSQTNTKDQSSTRFESVDVNKNVVSKNSDELSEKAIAEGVRNGESKKNINDIRTSTISENTQDHENSVNQEDWNHIEDEKSPYDTIDGLDRPIDIVNHNRNIPEPSEQKDIISHYHNIRSDEESHFFTYFTIISLISIAAYVGYHNKQKILAIVLEGRKSRNNRGRRRPSTANYRKLDCTLEEAVTSQCNANVTHVIYQMF